MIHQYAYNPQGVIVNLDGDDWLYDKHVLAYIARTYQKNDCWLTYGDCVLWDGKNESKTVSSWKPYTNIPYPKSVANQKAYRKYPFLPLHPRTWKVWLFKKIRKEDFFRPDGSWLQFAEDQAIFYPLLEMSNGKYHVFKKPLSVYNNASNISDLKINTFGLLRDELIIRKKQAYANI